MRIIVMSDSHGDYFAIEDIIKRNPSADIYIHLGDGQRECDRIALKYPDKQLWHLKGNCDYASTSLLDMTLDLEYGHKLFACHGHTYGVKYSLDAIKSMAVKNSADIIAYGHTHTRYENYEDELHIINPGSSSCPRDGNKASYGYIDITPAGVVTNIVSLY